MNSNTKNSLICINLIILLFIVPFHLLTFFQERKIIEKFMELNRNVQILVGASNGDVQEDERVQSIPELSNDHWADGNCFEPTKRPIIGTPDLSRILNMGFPKCGSTSLQRIFATSSFFGGNSRVRHYSCGKQGYCGECMKIRNSRGEPLLSGCGNFTVYTQMDVINRQCTFPQIQFLDKLYEEAPNATWILPFREIKSWVRSIRNWDADGKFATMSKRFKKYCSFPELNFTQHDGGEAEDYVQLYCNHVKQVRKFVRDHPSLSLIEFNIADPNVGDLLSSVLPVNASDWGQQNKNVKLE